MSGDLPAYAVRHGSGEKWRSDILCGNALMFHELAAGKEIEFEVLCQRESLAVLVDLTCDPERKQWIDVESEEKVIDFSQIDFSRAEALRLIPSVGTTAAVLGFAIWMWWCWNILRARGRRLAGET